MQFFGEETSIGYSLRRWLILLGLYAFLLFWNEYGEALVAFLRKLKRRHERDLLESAPWNRRHKK